MRPAYPFSAIVGQEQLKRALLLNAVDPSIGGVLIQGEKGTAKSTAARALAALLPPILAVAGCPFQCAPDDPPESCPWCSERAAAGEARSAEQRPAPLVELPVAATEDRVAGSFSLEYAVRHGVRRFEPGLLAAANRGILYVDEVNLLPDHLIDAILDAAATGVHRVEREGISVAHAARFILVGTMNPEEGELRPQLLDRFGLAVAVTTPREPAARAAIVRSRIAYDADPAGFAARWADEETVLRERARQARALVHAVRMDDALLDLIGRICVAYEVDGLRADIVIYKAAAALAAMDGRDTATAADVRAAAELALPHRRRRQPFDESGFDPEPLDQLTGEHERDQVARGSSDGAGMSGPDGRDAAPDDGGIGSGEGSRDGADGPETEHDAAPVTTAATPHQNTRRTRSMPRPAPARGGRQGAASRERLGRYVTSRLFRGSSGDVAFDATLRAAATRPGDGKRAIRVQPSDLRQAVRESKRGRLLLFVVDASGSMAGQRRMALAKGAVQALLRGAYTSRDRVALIAFRGERAALVVPPTTSAILAGQRLAALPTGGRTPLAAALQLADQTLARQARSGAAGAAELGGLASAGAQVVVLVSDGRANVALAVGHGNPWTDALAAAGRLRARGVTALLVEPETGGGSGAGFTLGLTEALGDALGAELLRLHSPTPRGGEGDDGAHAAQLVAALRQARPRGVARWV